MQMIAIDCRFASTNGGLGRYTRELVLHLLARKDPFRFLLLVSPEASDWVRGLPCPETVLVRTVDAAHYSFKEQWVIPAILRRERANLFFSPHFNVPYVCPVPFVATIHDLILHRFPNAAPFWKRTAYRILMRRTVRRARTVISVSAFVRDEILAAYGEGAAKKTIVIHEGVSPQFAPRSSQEQLHVRRRYGLPPSFFLYIGNAKEHKNVPLLLKAFAALGETSPALVLVCGGREARGLRLPPRAVLLPFVDDADLPAVYSAARAFVTASAYEGFCLPVAEALACGCPVIAPNEGPFLDVTQGKAHLIESSREAWTRALLDPPESPQEFRSPSWAEAAGQTIDVFRQTLHGSSNRK